MGGECTKDGNEGGGPGGRGGREAWRPRMQKETEKGEGQIQICSAISGMRMTDHKDILRSDLLLKLNEVSST